MGDGTAALTIGNPHGDNVTTVILPAGQAETTPAVSINGWADYDEYGVSKTGQPQGVTYGWLGKHERSASIESAGLTLMGVRLYNPVRGAFTTTDPIAGGNTTAYAYPQDPVNMVDLDGLMFRKVWVKKAYIKIGKKKVFTGWRWGFTLTKSATKKIANPAKAMGLYKTFLHTLLKGLAAAKLIEKGALASLKNVYVRAAFFAIVAIASAWAGGAKLVGRCAAYTAFTPRIGPTSGVALWKKC